MVLTNKNLLIQFEERKLLVCFIVKYSVKISIGREVILYDDGRSLKSIIRVRA